MVDKRRKSMVDLREFRAALDLARSLYRKNDGHLRQTLECREIANFLGLSNFAVWHAYNRGDLGVPSPNPARAEAWATGEPSYEVPDGSRGSGSRFSILSILNNSRRSVLGHSSNSERWQWVQVTHTHLIRQTAQPWLRWSCRRVVCRSGTLDDEPRAMSFITEPPIACIVKSEEWHASRQHKRIPFQCEVLLSASDSRTAQHTAVECAKQLEGVLLTDASGCIVKQQNNFIRNPFWLSLFQLPLL